LGASWEGFVLEQLLQAAEPDQAYFWATHQGAEIDLLMFRGSRRVGVEIKRPRETPPLSHGCPRIGLEVARRQNRAFQWLFPGFFETSRLYRTSAEVAGKERLVGRLATELPV
jgi:hypothetical protein